MSKNLSNVYIPPKLRDRGLTDFKLRDDGAYEFMDGKSEPGEYPRRIIGEKEFQNTFNREHRMSHPDEAMNKAWGHESSNHESLGTLGGDLLGGSLSSALQWSAKSPMTKGVTAAALAAAAAAGYVGLNKYKQGYSLKSSAKTGGKWALGAAGLAALGGMYVHSRTKGHSYTPPMSKSGALQERTLADALAEDRSIGFQQKAAIMRASGMLSGYDRRSLDRLLSTAMGGAAGVLAMRYLGSKGLMGNMLGGLIGAYTGRAMVTPSITRNAFGQLSSLQPNYF